MSTCFSEKRGVETAFSFNTYAYVWRFVYFMAMLSIFGGLLTLPEPSMAQPRRIRLIAFGDSLTAGYLLPARAAFPNVLERALKATGLDVEVVNAGVSGDTANGGLDRLDWALGEGADAMILELGANDMLRGLDPEITYKALKEIVAKAHEKGLKVLLTGMIAAPGLGRDYEERFNRVFPRIADEMKISIYPFFLEGVAGRRELQMSDGLHPTAAGVELIVAHILPAVHELIGSIVNKQ